MENLASLPMKLIIFKVSVLYGITRSERRKIFQAFNDLGYMSAWLAEANNPSQAERFLAKKNNSIYYNLVKYIKCVRESSYSNVEGFNALCVMSQVHRENVIYLGDEYSNISRIKDCGATTILCSPDFPMEGSRDIDHVIRYPMQLLNYQTIEL